MTTTTEAPATLTTCSECGAVLTVSATQGTPGMPVYDAADGSECPSGAAHIPQEAPVTLTRAEAAYAHLASFQRGDKVDVQGRGWSQYGTVTLPQQHDWSDINRAYLEVTGIGSIDLRVTVGDLLAGKYALVLVDAKAV